MKSKSLIILGAVAGIIIIYAVFLPSPWAATREKIYDESADGTQQISDALAQARPGHKRVLLDFGANWCGPCHLLHSFLSSDQPVKDELAKHYLVVMLDVNQQHNAGVTQKYGFPTDFGIPVLVVLDADGHQLVTQAPDAFVNETYEYDSPKTVAFLEKWAVTP